MDRRLRRAIRTGNFAQVQRNAEAARTHRDYGECHTHAASASGNLQILQYLLENGACVQCIQQCAQVASENGHLAALQCLIENGADVCAQNNWCVRGAAERGHLAVVEYLVGLLDIDICMFSDASIQLIAMYGHLEVLRFLASTADAQKNVHVKYTCVKAAIRHGHEAFVRHAVELGADVCSLDCVLAAAEGGRVSLVRFLADLGADICAGMELASSRGHLEIVRFLVEERGVDARVDGDIYLQKATEGGRDAVVRYLIGRGADFHARSEHCLFVAVRNYHLNLVKFLVSAGADPRICWACNPSSQIHLTLLGVYPGTRIKQGTLPCARAASRLYFAWLPRCFDRGRRAGRRMARRNFRAFRRL